MCFVTPWIWEFPNIHRESRLNGGAGCRAQGGRVFWLAHRCGGAELLFPVLEGGTDEGGKEWMRLEWLGLEFRVELAA